MLKSNDNPPPPHEIPPFVMTELETDWYLAGIEAFQSGYGPRGYLKACNLSKPHGKNCDAFYKGWRDAFAAESPEPDNGTDDLPEGNNHG